MSIFIFADKSEVKEAFTVRMIGPGRAGTNDLVTDNEPTAMRAAEALHGLYPRARVQVIHDDGSLLWQNGESIGKEEPKSESKADSKVEAKKELEPA